jgi:hypothetical protein
MVLSMLLLGRACPMRAWQAGAGPSSKMKRKDYEREIKILHGQLVAIQELRVPRISSTSCDQAIFVDHATDSRAPSDTVLLKVDGFR